MIGYWTLIYRELRWASVTPPATGWPADGWPRALLPLKWSISSYHGLLLVSPLWETPLATQDRRYGPLQRSPLLRYFCRTDPRVSLGNVITSQSRLPVGRCEDDTSAAGELFR